MEDKALEFLAQILNSIDTKREGYTASVRWLCLRDDLRRKYLVRAQRIVDEWWADELEAKKAREGRIKYATPKEVKQQYIDGKARI